MFNRALLSVIRPNPVSSHLEFTEGIEEDGHITSGLVLDPATGKTYPMRSGYLDLIGTRSGADNIANLTNFLPGAGPAYEPLWRVRSLNLLTGEDFPNERELEIITDLVQLDRGGLYLDLGCSAGLYTRSLAAKLGNRGDVVGIDISPSMLKEAVRRAQKLGTSPSFIRTDAENLPFAYASFAGVVCGGSLNEFGDPARVLRETRRILESGARVAIMGILRAKTSRGRRLQRFLSTGGVRFFEPEEVLSLLDHAGFEPDPLQTYNTVFFASAARR
ncbi:MAG: class I SAM-dependent methyltransferase [Actinobacteria bacterium]|nr:class I SAM-dependent methyltransferase [Actinomycetota bacterium]